MAARVKIENLALNKAFCKPLVSNVSDVFKRINFQQPDEIENL